MARLRALLLSGVDVNSKNGDGHTMLHLLAKGDGSEDAVDAIVVLNAFEADFNAESSDGKTPLHLAAEEDNRSVGAMLVGFGANIDNLMVLEDGELQQVLPEGQDEREYRNFIRAILPLVEEIFPPDPVEPVEPPDPVDHPLEVQEVELGMDDLQQAVLDAVKFGLLLSLQSSVEDQEDDRERLFFAFLRDDKAMAEAILRDPGGDVNVVSNDNLGLLHYCVLEERLDWIDFLSSFDMDIDLSVGGMATPLFFSTYSNSPKMAEKLIELGANPNQEDPGGRPLLTVIAEKGNVDMGVVFVKGGANITTLDESHGDFKRAIIERPGP